MVDSLMLSNGAWNITRLCDLFDGTKVTNITKIFWANMDLDDKLVWLGTSSSEFKVKSIYKYLHPVRSTNLEWWRSLWNNTLHELL